MFVSYIGAPKKHLITFVSNAGSLALGIIKSDIFCKSDKKATTLLSWPNAPIRINLLGIIF